MALAAFFNLAACQRDAGQVMQEVQRAEQSRLERNSAIGAESARFIAEKRRAPGVRTTASGLSYRITRPPPDPELASPTREALVLVNYEGRLLDGTVFESSEQRNGGAVMIPIAAVPAGLREAIMLMRPGEELIAYLPPDLAYGERGAPPAIPPNAAVQFRVELLAYTRGDGTVIMAPSQ
jgi:FKBP-type peptidyl-prolyl cis-trans isomerase